MSREVRERVLVDSTIYIGLLRRGIDPIQTLGQWIGSGDLAVCGVVRMEVLRGLRDGKVRREIADFLDTQVQLATRERFWREATDLAWRLDRKGRVLPVTDILIASLALAAQASVLSDDGHFAMVPGLQVQHPGEVLPEWLPMPQ